MEATYNGEDGEYLRALVKDQGRRIEELDREGTRLNLLVDRLRRRISFAAEYLVETDEVC